MFQKKKCDWTEFRKLPGLMEYDFHLTGQRSSQPYWEKMEIVWADTLETLKDAQKKGFQYVLFTHGHSTSRNGATTSRSQIRGVMRSKEATPYIIRKECIQHDSVFVVKIRPLKGSGEVS